MYHKQNFKKIYFVFTRSITIAWGDLDVHNVNNVNISNRFCYAVFPEYSFERNDEINLDSGLEAEVDISSGIEPTAANILQETTVAATDKLGVKEEDQPSNDHRQHGSADLL